MKRKLDQSGSSNITSDALWNKSISKLLWIPTGKPQSDRTQPPRWFDINRLVHEVKELKEEKWEEKYEEKQEEKYEKNRERKYGHEEKKTSLWSKISDWNESKEHKVCKKPAIKRCKQRGEAKEEKKEKVKKKQPIPLKCKKIRLFPDSEQRNCLNQWFGAARWTYNKCVDAMKARNGKATIKLLRSLCIKEEALDTLNAQWAKEIPFDIRDEAARDVIKAYKTCWSLYRNGRIKKFDIKYKSKRAESDSIVIHAKHYKGKGLFYPRIFGKEPIHSNEELPDAIAYDCRLQRTRLGHFYLCLLEPIVVASESRAPKVSTTHNGLDHIISLDPGVRTFMVGYDPSGKLIEWAPAAMDTIFRLCYRVDMLTSICYSKGTRKRMRYRLRKRTRRIRLRIRNKIDDVHKRLAKWLCQNYRIVLLPKFETQQMVNSNIRRKISSKTARGMLTWAHYRFQQRLKSKAREYPWCKIIIVDEQWTSKTCGLCGFIHRGLGSSKTFHCPKCKVTLDRDANGARNILIRFLLKHGLAIH